MTPELREEMDLSKDAFDFRVSKPVIVEYLLSGIQRKKGRTYSIGTEPSENYYLSECVMIVPEAPIAALPADHGFWNWNAPNFIACALNTRVSNE